jgi:glycine/D-amino acid oxidase-like deaminating enzyme
MLRRSFLAALPGGLFAACEFRDGVAQPAGELQGPDMALGHAMRDRALPAPGEERRIDVAVIGAGIGGLSAAWRLARRGIASVGLFELDTAAGGNARFGTNPITAYPLGAHYLPLPTREAVHVRELLADLGVLKGDPQAALPQYDERYLVGAPQERLYRGGLWYEGLLPRAGLDAREAGQIGRFEEAVDRLKTARGSDGRRLFGIPSLLASADPTHRTLDRISMAAWMAQQGFDSPLLNWYVDYGCRDDYGARATEVSAWAGLHYFACRDGQGRDADPHTVLTWPEGNGWLVRQMLAWLAARGVAAPLTGAACARIETAAGHATFDIYLAREKRSVRYRAQHVIWAAPAFALARAWVNPPAGFAAACAGIATSAWLVANLTLNGLPEDAGPAGLAWDNVLYDSPALGYVVATHQQMRVKPGPTVLTYYRPLADLPPAQARARLANQPWRTWVDPILAELARPHPGLRRQLDRIDLWRWPHAMPRPVPGYLRAPIRALLAELTGPLHFAHSDLSGLPLFEEANFAGVRAADSVARRA